MTKDRWRVVLVLSFALFAVFCASTVISTLIPVISAQTLLNPLESGAILACFGYTYGAMQIPVGFASDRYEPKKIITISMLGLFFATFFFSFSSNFIQMLTSRLLMGAAGSFLFVDGLKTIEMHLERRARGAAIGIFVSFSYLAITVSNLVAELFFQSAGASWRDIYRGTSFVVLAAGIIAFTFLPSRILPSASRAQLQERNDLHQEPIDSYGSSRNYKGELFRVISNKSFWIQTIVSFVSFGSSFAIIYWFPTYFEARGFGLAYGSLAVALIGIGSTIGTIGGGFIVDKLKKRLPIIRASLLLYAGFLLVIVLLPFSSRLWIIPFVASFAIGLSQGGQIANTRTVAELFPRETVGIAFGLYNCISWIGSAIYPFLVGAILNAELPFGIGFLPIFGSLLIGVGVTIASTETGVLPEGGSGPEAKSQGDVK